MGQDKQHRPPQNWGPLLCRILLRGEEISQGLLISTEVGPSSSLNRRGMLT